MVLYFYFLLFIAPGIYFYPSFLQIGVFKRKIDTTIIPLDFFDRILLAVLFVFMRIILLLVLYVSLNQLSSFGFSPLLALFSILILDLIYWVAVRSIRWEPRTSPYKKAAYLQVLELIFVTPIAMLIEILGYVITSTA